MADQQEELDAARSALKACLRSTGGAWSPKADDLAETLACEMLGAGLALGQALTELRQLGASEEGAESLTRIASKRLATPWTRGLDRIEKRARPRQHSPVGATTQMGSGALFAEWARYTFGNLGWLTVGVLAWTVLIGVISIPVVLFFVLLLKALPNLWRALFSIFVSLPVLLLLPFHAVVAFLLVLVRRRPRYDVGLYAAAQWVNGPPIWNPFEDLEQ